MGHTMFASDGMFMLLTFLPIIFYLVVVVFAIYFVIKLIRFMNEKTRLDRERNEKLSELIKALKDE
ncbi:hypothetical protein R4Z10_10240 [Niallia sp. XMNu-256]|uniref:hypothetical protein n=1 Tax=Niallia sp. XMNu-256 TaxID=3082444 RepID=UPI0030D0BD8A